MIHSLIRDRDGVIRPQYRNLTLPPLPDETHYDEPDSAATEQELDDIRSRSDVDLLAEHEDCPDTRDSILAGQELARRLDAGNWTLGTAV